MATAHIVESFSADRIWAGIRQFRNASVALREIEFRHSVPKQQKKNAVKQAQQIGYCISQAEEYFQAAASVGLATKPVLLYYGVMSLALAEILMKQSGESSLDMARGKNAHHGLDFRYAGKKSGSVVLEEEATGLRAVPLTVGSERRGTFELWRRTASAGPLIGKTTNRTSEGGQQVMIGVVSDQNAEAIQPLANGGITLLECMRMIPDITDVNLSHGISTRLVRGCIQRNIDFVRKTAELEIFLHPSPADAMEDVVEKITFPANAIPFVEAISFTSGYAVTISGPLDHLDFSFKLPSSIQKKSWECHFCATDGLNEFGLYYVSLFMLGSLARYYPDHWMKHISVYSALAAVANELMDSAMLRVPSLALGELTRSHLCLSENLMR